MPKAIAEIITPQIPYLRRFARVLTGSQDSGDAYVVSTIEAIIADTRIFARDLQPRAALFKTFLEVWNAMPLNGTPEPAGNVLERRIETLTPLPRQAFLLTAVEEFAPGDVAAILGKTEGEVRELIDLAGREISEQIAAKVMIIEDEPMIALDIETLVTEIGHEVVGIAATRREANQLAKSSNPGIILSDIQLADGSSGIDAVNDILKEKSVPVIFITAYPERLLTGERAEPAFLITKPFQPEMVKAVISQVLFFDTKAATAGRKLI